MLVVVRAERRVRLCEGIDDGLAISCIVNDIVNRKLLVLKSEFVCISNKTMLANLEVCHERHENGEKVLHVCAVTSRHLGTERECFLCTTIGPGGEEAVGRPSAPTFDKRLKRCRLDFSYRRHGHVMKRVKVTAFMRMNLPLS
jgi:hypothetical protein